MGRCYLVTNIAALMLLFMLSLLALGFFAGAVDIINGQARDSGRQHWCILFATGSHHLSESATCGLVTYGQAVILVFSLACFIAHHLIEKCVARVGILHSFLITELVAYIVLAVLALCLGVAFTVGIVSTCGSLVREGSCSSCNRCRFFESGKPGTFFSLLMLALVFTWSEVAVLVGVTIFDITWLCSIYKKQAKVAERQALLKEEEKNSGALL